MAKQGMRRYQYDPPAGAENCHRTKKEPIVPEIGGKAKHGKEKARPIIEGTDEYKVFHELRGDGSVGDAHKPHA